jgi:hypothetical protein
MILPNFLIGGAPRAGTTFLYEILDEHSEIYLAKPRSPEPKFFLIDDEFQKGLAYYAEKYFSGADGRKAMGEKSTNYLENPHVAGRIRAMLPGVKLLFLLRNPIERAFSNYLWSKQNQLEMLSFDEAVETEPVREAQYPPSHRYSRPFSYVSRGMYAAHLRPYFAAFPAEQIKVVLLDDLEERPQAQIDAIVQFLGLRTLPSSGDLRRRVNSAREGNEQIGGPIRDKLKEIYRTPNRKLAELLKRDLSHWS